MDLKDLEVPFVVRLVLRWVPPTESREAILGDLTEEFTTAKVPEIGMREARRWALKETLRSAPPLLLQRVQPRAAEQGLRCGIGLLGGGLAVFLPLKALLVFTLIQVPLRAAEASFSVQTGFWSLVAGGCVAGFLLSRSLLGPALIKREDA